MLNRGDGCCHRCRRCCSKTRYCQFRLRRLIATRKAHGVTATHKNGQKCHQPNPTDLCSIIIFIKHKFLQWTRHTPESRREPLSADNVQCFNLFIALSFHQSLHFVRLFFTLAPLLPQCPTAIAMHACNYIRTKLEQLWFIEMIIQLHFHRHFVIFPHIASKNDKHENKNDKEFCHLSARYLPLQQTAQVTRLEVKERIS